MRAQALIDRLRDVRKTQLALFSDLDDAQLLGSEAHHIEPPIWEMGHVAWFQEYWILRHLGGVEPLLAAGDSIYDAFNVSYKLRATHDFPTREATLTYASEILDRCERRLPDGEASPEEAYFYELVALHEGMHSENLLGVRQALGYPRPAILDGVAPHVEAGYESVDVEVPGGAYQVGAPRGGTSFVFDNEKWSHEVRVEPFRIASAAVTNEEYAHFVDAGGYAKRSYWGHHPWEWRRRAKCEHPLAWQKVDGVWHERVFDALAPLHPRKPVCHVNWYEANAYCRWAGRRLPTEAEWEIAASFDPASGRQHRYPWGDEPPTRDHANLDFAWGGVVEIGAFPRGDSPLGCRQMIGNLWEWTSSVLTPYSGFEPDPYDEYSVPYFGQKPILRGGCFATRADLIRNTWRNFFIRHRRNIFAGFRTCP